MTRPGYPQGFRPVPASGIHDTNSRAASQLAGAIRGPRPPDYVPQPIGTEMIASGSAQRGPTIQKLPDAAYQPESAQGIKICIPQTLCPIGFTGTTAWTTVLTYPLQANRKLVITDACIIFSNPYTALVASARIAAAGNVLELVPRIQIPCCGNPGVRSIVYGATEVTLEIKRDALSSGWDLGLFQGWITGWDVPTQFDQDERMLK